MSFCVEQITDNKKQYLELLLLADEQELMIDRYLERGEMFILEDGILLKDMIYLKQKVK